MENTSPEGATRRGLNRPLLLGLTFVISITILAFAGPSIAPRNPLERNEVIRINERYLTPPYQPFTPGFPLGSDELGRDLLSRLLWGLRPTFTMVLVVAGARLILGTLIGLISGWSKRWPGRISDIAISAALSIPIIIVALVGIAAVGVELGIWAFIVGLSLTGWVETARVVREQTRTVRGQAYVEAARAFGASSAQILQDHVIQQILPLIWMLFAFEISSTFMLVAALGFLGYYIGGDVWVQIEDPVARAISGVPELGQMLATIELSPTKPWALMIIGVFVFAIIFSFTLLGEGLRRRLSLYAPRSQSFPARLIWRLRFWLDENIWWPLSKSALPKALRLAIAFVVIGGLLGAIFWQRREAYLEAKGAGLVSAFPQDSLWAASQHDPFGTHWTQVIGPGEPVIAWTYETSSGFAGGPAVAQDGSIYISTIDGNLYAFNPKGDVKWQTILPAGGIGAPAIGSGGDIFVADSKGGLSRFTARGELLWHYEPKGDFPATTGPVVAPSGAVYYVTGPVVQAVSKIGNGLWTAQPQTNVPQTEMIDLSPDGGFLQWGDDLLDTRDGSTPTHGGLPTPDKFLTGADGESYLLYGNELVRYDMTGSEASILDTISWDYSKFTISRRPEQVGVTPDKVIWMVYGGFSKTFGFGEDLRVVWLDPHGKLLGNVHYPTRGNHVIGVDQDNTIYNCGNMDFGYGDLDCQAFSPGSDEPLWDFRFDNDRQFSGGAVASGRLYIATGEGVLFAVGSGDDRIPSNEIKQTSEQDSSRRANLLDFAGNPIGPVTPDSRLIFRDESGFSGGPVISDDGVLYVCSNDGTLYALNQEGDVLWHEKLPEGGVGKIALTDQGNVLAVAKDGSLSAFSSSGELLWKSQTESGLKGISGPFVGPNGRIYYTVGTSSKGSIQAVSPDGSPLWLANMRTQQFYAQPEVSENGEFVLFVDEVLAAESGSHLDMNPGFNVRRYFTGEDGKNYLSAGGTIAAWQRVVNGIDVADARVLSSKGTPLETGVTEQGVVWMLYQDGVLWYDRDGPALGSSITERTYPNHMIDIDKDFTIYAGGRQGGNPVCFALSPNSEEPIWKVVLNDEFDTVIGGALAPGRLYVSTEHGRLFVLSDR